MKKHILFLFSLALLTVTNSLIAQGTAFTYQGQLQSGGSPANGNYDFTFALFNNPATNTGQIGGTLTDVDVGVTNGLFTVTLDFGSVFAGNATWLSIAVRTNGGAGFTALSPLQELTPTPYAIYTPNAGAAASAGSVAAANIVGTVSAGQLPSSVVTNGESGVNITGTFSGNGAGVTNVNLLYANTEGAITFTTNYGTFLLSSSPGVGANQQFVCAADVNGDGKLDLISANTGRNSLTVLTNNGSGGFVSNASYAVGSGPDCVCAADVNGDGKADLICVNYNGGSGNTLTVLTNNGSGGFVLSGTYTVGTGPFSVCAADVNGDGSVDLICANLGTPGGSVGNTLTVLTNNGSGGFVLSSSPGVGSGPRSVCAADVNGDGKIDLICANDDGNSLTVLTNNGSGGFVSNASYTVGGFPYAVCAADVNGDGKIDLICANNGGNSLTVLTNNGSGGFVTSGTNGVGHPPYFVCAADVNGDGKVDLICANYSVNSLVVLTNNGSGGFVSNASYTVGGSPVCVCAADVNGDGKIDLICANNGGNSLSVLLNTAVYSGAFIGNGAGLTGLTAANLTGPLPAISGANLTSLNAASLTGALPAISGTNLTGVALLSGGNSFTGNQSVNGTVTATSFSGNGGGLTGLNAASLTGALPAISGASLITLNASQLTSGTIPQAQLPASVITNGASGVDITGIFSGNGSGLSSLDLNGTEGALRVASTPVVYSQGAGPSGAMGILVAGNYAGVGCGTNGLSIFDISNLLAPSLVSVCNQGFTTYGFALNQGYMYVASEDAGMRVYSVANFASPVFVTQVADAAPYYQVVLSGSYAYVDGYSNIAIYSLGNPASPALVGLIPKLPLVTSIQLGRSLAVAGNYLYCADPEGLSFNIYSITNPASPVLLSRTTNICAGVTISGNLAFLSAVNYGFLIYDISNPTAPNLLASNRPPGSMPQTGVLDIGVSGNRCFMAYNGLGLAEYDISVPTNPVRLNVFPDTTNITDLVLWDNFVLTANSTGNPLQVFAVGDTADLVAGASTNGVIGNAVGVTIAGGGAQTYLFTQNPFGPPASIGGPNQVGADFGTISGGLDNTISNGAVAAVIDGGGGNMIESNALAAVIGGGYGNTIGANSQISFIGGGDANTISSNVMMAVIAGGSHNFINANTAGAVIGGGQSNQVSTNAQNATIPGGDQNVAAGNGSFAAGQQAQALHQGAFVWADSSSGPYSSTTNNQFAVRASGGVRFDTSGGGLLIDGQPFQSTSTTNASQLTTGTLNDARLSANVPLLNANQTFTGQNTFNNNVGINTTTPAASLDVNGNIHASGAFNGNGSGLTALTAANLTGALPAISGASLTALNASQLTSGTIPQAQLPPTIAFLNSNQTFTGQNNFSGNVGIGTTGPDALLSVNGAADKPGGGSWSTFSDARLKDVGPDFTHGMEALEGLRPVHYHYKSDNPLNLPSRPDYIGVVAQQVQEAIPEAVQRNRDGYLTVNNDPIIWTMVNAIKELNQKNEAAAKARDEEIEKQQQEIDELKAAVQVLSGKK